MGDLKVLLQIRWALVAMLGTLLFIVLATSMLAIRPQPEEPRFYCGNAITYTPRPADERAYMQGRELFIANCATCHNKNMKDKLTGPALAGTQERWAKYPRKDLYNFIRHAPQMLKSKHPRARQLWKENKPTVMDEFSALTDENITALLVYIEPRY